MNQQAQMDTVYLNAMPKHIKYPVFVLLTFASHKFIKRAIENLDRHFDFQRSRLIRYNKERHSVTNVLIKIYRMCKVQEECKVIVTIYLCLSVQMNVRTDLFLKTILNVFNVN